MLPFVLLMIALSIGPAAADEPPGYRGVAQRPATSAPPPALRRTMRFDWPTGRHGALTDCPADRGIYVRVEDAATFVVERYGLRPGKLAYEILAGKLDGRRAYYLWGIGPTGTGWGESSFDLSDPAFKNVTWGRPWSHGQLLTAEEMRPAIASGPLGGDWQLEGCRSH